MQIFKMWLSLPLKDKCITLCKVVLRKITGKNQSW